MGLLGWDLFTGSQVFWSTGSNHPLGSELFPARDAQKFLSIDVAVSDTMFPERKRTAFAFGSL